MEAWNHSPRRFRFDSRRWKFLDRGGETPKEKPVEITTSFKQPIIKITALVGETISFNRFVSNEEIVEHLYYRGGSGIYRPTIQTGTNTFKIPTGNNQSTIFELTKEYGKLTITFAYYAASNGGEFFWGNMPENNLPEILISTMNYD